MYLDLELIDGVWVGIALYSWSELVMMKWLIEITGLNIYFSRIFSRKLVCLGLLQTNSLGSLSSTIECDYNVWHICEHDCRITHHWSPSMNLVAAADKIKIRKGGFVQAGENLLKICSNLIREFRNKRNHYNVKMRLSHGGRHSINNIQPTIWWVACLFLSRWKITLTYTPTCPPTQPPRNTHPSTHARMHAHPFPHTRHTRPRTHAHSHTRHTTLRAIQS